MGWTVYGRLTTKDIGIVCGPATYQLSGQDVSGTLEATTAIGVISALPIMPQQHGGGWWTNKRMPNAASNIQQAHPCIAKGRIDAHGCMSALEYRFLLTTSTQR